MDADPGELAIIGCCCFSEVFFMKGDGIKACVTCGHSLEEGNLGYCNQCIDHQVLIAELTDKTVKPTLKRIREYNESQRLEVEEFLNRDGLKLISREDVSKYLDKQIVFGIISPTYAPHIDYSLVRKVARLNPVDETRKQWLKDYWVMKYELDVPDFDDQVSLVFVSYSYYYEEEYEKVYDYPGSMIEAFAIIEQSAEVLSQ